MSTSQEAPDLIQYACERCKTRFVLPPSSRRLGIGGKVRAFSIGLGRTIRYREGLGASYDAAQRQLLAKMDDQAYQSFVKSFRFCHECRQFVCNECWSTSRRSCLTCVAKSMTGTARPRPPFAPAGPDIPRPVLAVGPGRSRRLRRDLALVALALGLVLVALEVGALFASMRNPATESPTPAPTEIAQATASPTASPSPSPTASPSPSPTASPSPSPTASPTASPSPSPSPSPTATPKPATPKPATPKPATPAPPPPTPTPVPTLPPLPTPLISCSSDVASWSCTWDNQNVMPNAKPTWFENLGNGWQNVGATFTPGLVSGGPYQAYLVVSQQGQSDSRSDTKTGP